MIVEFLDEARFELLLASARYEEEVQGLGSDLLDEVAHAVGRLVTFPRQGSPHLAGTRRLVLRRFPFDVVYLDEPDKLLIVAIAHHKRSPGYWRRRIDTSE